MKPYNFFAYLNRLKGIERWGLMRNWDNENVAEHSWTTAIYAFTLATIGNEVYGKNVRTDLVVFDALFHDITEVFLMDIPTPVKNISPEMRALFRQAETMFSKQLIKMLPPELQSSYKPFVMGSNETEVRKYVKAADKLDAYLKCVDEIRMGNHAEFGRAKKNIENELKALNMPEIDYFLEHFAPSFEMSLDELAE